MHTDRYAAPTRLLAVLLSTLVLSSACEAGAAEVQPFFDRAPWHDGQAEVNFYEASEIRYDERRTAEEAVLIFVKEDHLQDGQVKADDPQQADLPAVKLNWVVQIPTGIYTYRQQASVFVNRETNQPYRQTFASHEWCGNVFKELRLSGDAGWQYRWTSYFEDEGEGTRPIPIATEHPVVLADALPIYLRAARLNHTISVLPSLRSIRATPDDFKPTNATIRLLDHQRITVPAGTFAVQPVTVDYADGRQDRYLLEVGARRRIVKMELADGSIYELRRSIRTDYWNRNAPGDEAMKEGVGVEN
ncbi:MAG: hypothetical protein WD294_02020 [Phycisphaeraceae bacterium]